MLVIVLLHFSPLSLEVTTLPAFLLIDQLTMSTCILKHFKHRISKTSVVNTCIPFTDIHQFLTFCKIFSLALSLHIYPPVCNGVTIARKHLCPHAFDSYLQRKLNTSVNIFKKRTFSYKLNNTFITLRKFNIILLSGI